MKKRILISLVLVLGFCGLAWGAGKTIEGDLKLGRSADVPGNLYMYDAGVLTMYDNAGDTNVVVGPVADGTTTLGVTGGLSVSGNVESATITVGGTTLYAGRAITVDTGGVLNIVLSDAAGDDFTVDTDKLVVEGDTGNVGIGTVSPAGNLHIYDGASGGTPVATSLIIEDSGHTYINFMTANDKIQGIEFGDPEDNNIGRIEYDHTLDTLEFWTSAAQQMTIDSSGNVGIGTASPGAALDVRSVLSLFGATRGKSYLRTNGLGFNYDTDSNSTGYINWTGFEGGVTQFRDLHISDGKNGTVAFFDGSGGNVGIGTTSPGYTLDVTKAVNSNWLVNMLNSGTTSAHGLLVSIGASSTGSPFAVYKESTAYLYINNAGDVGIGTASPNQLLTVESSISLKEIADATADTAAYGQIWVHNTAPNELWFTDDAGTDTQISPHPLDAPPELYTNGPGLDWMGKRIQPYLGVIFWQTLNGTITEETFDAYNLRRKDVDGHKDLVKQDWGVIQLAKLRAQKIEEGITTPEVEVSKDDAFEQIEITDDVQDGVDTKYNYTLDKDGNVVINAIETPKMIEQGTGKFEKKLKGGVTFLPDTGKFIRTKSHRKLTEGEADALQLKAPDMPGWMKKWVEDNPIVVEK